MIEITHKTWYVLLMIWDFEWISDPEIVFLLTVRVFGTNLQEGVDPEGFDEFFLNPAGGQLEEPAVEAASKDRRLRRLFQENLEDEDLTQQPIPEGAAVTFNYLIDAILAVSRTKQMYLRRLRTLMDQFTNGRLEVCLVDLV